MKVKDLIERLAEEDGEKEILSYGCCDPECRHCYGGTIVKIRENAEGQIEIISTFMAL